MMKTAVLVVDMQERYFQAGRPLEASRKSLVASIVKLLNYAIAGGWPIYFSKEEYKEDFSDAPHVYKKLALPEVVKGHPMAEILKEFKSFINNNEIVKHRHSSFENTSLREKLEKDGIKELIITGINTDTCVLSACLGARMDFDVVIPRECVFSTREDMHEVAMKLLSCKAEVKNLDQILSRKKNDEIA